MGSARIIGRAVLLVGIFAGAGVLTSRALIAHAVAHGTPEYEVRLAGEMGGLFAGGTAALLTGVAMVVFRRRSPAGDPGDPGETARKG